MFVKRFPVIGILLALALIATACAAVPAAGNGPGRHSWSGDG